MRGMPRSAVVSNSVMRLAAGLVDLSSRCIPERRLMALTFGYALLRAGNGEEKGTYRAEVRTMLSSTNQDTSLPPQQRRSRIKPLLSVCATRILPTRPRHARLHAFRHLARGSRSKCSSSTARGHVHRRPQVASTTAPRRFSPCCTIAARIRTTRTTPPMMHDHALDRHDPTHSVRTP
ncbi:hypothetical protein BC628DRAFT_955241 [Trametes gibbosa]|nr:hypothetical protein BC628DRAFT_955241 [Trametes gibbosa]